MRKFGFICLSLAAIALATVSCKKEQKNPPQEEEQEQQEEEIIWPAVDAPAAGQTTIVLAVPADDTPAGCYAVGTVNGWAEKDTETAPFTKIEGNFYKLTVDYAADMQLKVLAIPSDPALVGWSYQWGKVFDPANPECEITEEQSAVVIANGTGEFELENSDKKGAQPKLIGLADAGVVYIQIKAWAASPVIKDEPCATAAIKHPWNGGDWTYVDMEAKGNATFTYAGRFGNNGCNIALNTAADQEVWYPTDAIEFGEGNFQTGDSVLFTFVSEKGTNGKVTITMIEKGEGNKDIPAGEGTFEVKILNREYAATDVCIFTGNFDEKSWGDSDRTMTYNPETQTWSWTGAYPMNFQYKVIYNGSWAAGDNVVFDGETYNAEFEIQ